MSGAAPADAPHLRALIERAGALPAAPAAGARHTAERCGLCGLPVPAEHRHVLDLASRELQCACRACAVLFDHTAAGGRHFRLVPRVCRRAPGPELDGLDWRALGIPVRMAFFVRDGATGAVSAFYPSPAGATRAELEMAELAEHPALAGLEPDVEGLLARRADGRTTAFVVGLEDCYRLVAVLRAHWRGFTGGAVVWTELERFFAELERRAESQS